MYAKSVINVKNRTKKVEKKYEKLNQNFFNKKLSTEYEGC